MVVAAALPATLTCHLHSGLLIGTESFSTVVSIVKPLFGEVQTKPGSVQKVGVVASGRSSHSGVGRGLVQVAGRLIYSERHVVVGFSFRYDDGWKLRGSIDVGRRRRDV